MQLNAINDTIEPSTTTTATDDLAVDTATSTWSSDIDFERQTNEERRLVEYLMRNYDNSIRPVRNSNNPVVIRLGITLTQIFDLVSV